jgi:hypothetical protein
MILGLAERFGQPPHTVLGWPSETLQWVMIEARGTPEKEVPGDE